MARCRRESTMIPLTPVSPVWKPDNGVASPRYGAVRAMAPCAHGTPPSSTFVRTAPPQAGAGGSDVQLRSDPTCRSARPSHSERPSHHFRAAVRHADCIGSAGGGQVVTIPSNGMQGTGGEPVNANSVLRTHEAAQHCGLTTRWLRELAKSDPNFPAAIQLGKRARGWRMCDLDAWLESRRQK